MTDQNRPLRVDGSAFLETNVLIDLYIYWDLCRRAGLRLDEVDSRSELRNALQQRIPMIRYTVADDFRDAENGRKCFRNVLEASGDYLFYTSHLCLSEMHHVLIESVASELLTQHKVPYSVRRRRPQILHRNVIEAEDYKNISERLDEFRDVFNKDYKIRIEPVEGVGSGGIVEFQMIMSTAEAIWRRVLIEVMDCYILSAAILAKVDCFLTRDKALQDALRDISKASGSELRGLVGLGPEEKFPVVHKPANPLPENRTAGSGQA